MIFPSLFEGAGLPALEATIKGIPLVSSDLPAVKEYIGDNAIYFNPLSVEDIADKISVAFNQSDLQQTAIKRKELFADKYSWKKTMTSYAAIYRKALGMQLSAAENDIIRSCQP